ncbi:MAG: TRAP transporter substrate-binding protein DctP [Serpentinimonas sp.]|nr:TRAP transporter substrate-binding protein DctP [Serpentinimonas sp.]
MDRRSIIAGTGAVGVAGLLAACGPREQAAAPAAAPGAPAVITGETVRWRLASTFPRALSTIWGAADVFAKAVSDATGGRFQVSTHPAGELVPAMGVFDAAQAGTIEVAHTATYFFFGKDDALALANGGISFGLNGRQMTAWFYEGGGLALSRELLDTFNLVNFACGNTGVQMGGWFRREIRSPADLQGLRFRAGGFAGRVLQRMGVVPLGMPAGEIFQALERGTVDGAEFVGPYDDEKLGFHRVAPFYYYPGWWEAGTQLDLLINKAAFNALSPEYQAIVNGAAAFAHTTMLARYDALNPAALKRLVAAGTRLMPFPRSVMDASFRAAHELYDELNATNPRWKKLYDHQIAFRRDQVMWHGLAEASFDSYMQMQGRANRL